MWDIRLGHCYLWGITKRGYSIRDDVRDEDVLIIIRGGGGCILLQDIIIKKNALEGGILITLNICIDMVY